MPLGELIRQGRLRDIDQSVLLKGVSDRFDDMDLSLVRGDYHSDPFADRTTRVWVQGQGDDGLV